MSEWSFDPPPNIEDREVGLAAVLKKVRYDLTAAQAKLSEALRMVAEMDLPDEPEDRASFMNGPVLAATCPVCGIGGDLHASDCAREAEPDANPKARSEDVAA